MKHSDNRYVSISDVTSNISDYIREANETNEPIYVLNHSKPEAVIISHSVYEELVSRNEDLENHLYYTQVESRIIKGSGKLIPSSKVIESNKKTNPFSHLPDEDLFD